MNACTKILRGCTICLMLLLQSLGLLYGSTKIDSCLQAIKLYEGETNSLTYANLLHELGVNYLTARKYKEAKSVFEESLKISDDIKEERLLVRNYIKLAYISYWLSDHKKAIAYGLEPMNKYAHLLTESDSMNIFKNLANTYHYDGNLEAAYSS